MIRWMVIALLLSGGTVRAQAILDVAAVPNLPAASRASYASFLLTYLPRAFAVSTDGKMGWQGGGTTETAREKALASCASKGGKDCAVYAENLQVVWPGRKPEAQTPVPGPLFGGSGWEFVPDQRYFWRGPAAARGVYVFGHGLAPITQGNRDARGFQPHAYVRHFNNNGYDVIRFDREPGTDRTDEAAGWLREGLRKVRAMGYRQVIVGGQSRGAWNSLQILDTPGLADVVIAVSAAANGTDAARQAGFGMAELYQMFRTAASPAARVAIVNFRDDPFEQNPDKRFALADDLLAPRVTALLKINQPDGIKGHGGGYSLDFANRFGACLLSFATEARPPAAC